MKKLIITFLLIVQSAMGIEAQTLTPAGNNLYNTGYSGTVQAGNNQPDTHYQLIDFGNGTAYQANPLAAGWVADSASSQWITISPSSTAGASISYDYHLVLTNIPVGRLVTIGGSVAADDNVAISGNGSSPFFSNTAPGVVVGNYASFTTIPTFSFVSGAQNFLDFDVLNNGGGPTGLNLQLTGFYSVLTSTVGLNIRFDSPNLTRNQTSVLNYINQINAVGVNNACFTNLTAAFFLLNDANFGQALDQLSPEVFDVFSSIAFNNASFMTQGLDDYLAHRRNQAGYFQANPGGIDMSGLTISDPTIDPRLSQVYSHLLAWNPAPRSGGLMSDVADPLLATGSPGSPFPAGTDRWNFFLQGNVILGDTFSDQDLADRDSTTSSLELGADYEFSPNFLMGAFFNYNHTDTDLDNHGSSATIDSYAPGIYASYAKDGWYANALADYSHNAYTEQRNIGISTFNETTNGAPEGDQETVNVDGGYDFHKKNWTYGPTAGLQYTHLSIDSFTEDGGCSSDLAVGREAADSFRSRLGGHVSYTAKSDGVLFTPFVDASWQHEFLDDSRGITSSFSEIGMGQFTVYTPDPARESALIATGVNIDLNRMATIYTNYQVQIDPTDYFGQSVIVGAKLAF